MDLSHAYATLGSDLAGGFSIVLLTIVGMVLVVWDAFRPRATSLPWVAGLALAMGMVWELFSLRVGATTAFYDMIRVGGFASFVNLIVLGSAFCTVLLAKPYLQRIRHAYGEVYALILFATVGMLLLATANNLVAIFVGLETMSVTLYILTGLVREDEGAVEAALKYFLLGAFSTGFFLYGIALLYGATGTMYLPEMAAGFAARDTIVLFWAGVALLLVGFLFKISATPFHMWTPDVYQGAPTPLTGYMATASKTAAFASLILVLYYALGPILDVRWSIVLAVIATVTMVLGNALALVQRNVKRMLAYSSIAHAGYVLVGLTAGTAEGYAGALYYLLVYTLMNLGAFGVMAYLEWDDREGRVQTLDSLAGIGFRKPLLGVAMGVFMFSLTGFPPLGGFFGKLAVFAPAIDAGLTWLVVIGVLASVFSAYYYLRVLFVFWMRSPDEQPEAVQKAVFPVPTGVAVVVVACAVLLLVVGFVPLVRETADAFFETAVPMAMP